jgi:ATP-dependent HslUV protease ATP-binding subunit HslU
MRGMLRDGAKEDSMITMDNTERNLDGSGDGNMLLASLIANLENKKPKRRKRQMKVSEARPIIEEQEIEKRLGDYDVMKEAITAVEQNGIVFIDEIDKIISGGDHRSADASAEGVQRDLLPLIEGTTVQTKHGNVNTDFILFIASGAFHTNKPSDLLAELQGRLPIRVALKALSEADLYRILTEPVTNLLKQQVQLMKTENIELEFKDSAVSEIARVAFMVSFCS